jgi:hypothetical protein
MSAQIDDKCQSYDPANREGVQGRRCRQDKDDLKDEHDKSCQRGNQQAKPRALPD